MKEEEDEGQHKVRYREEVRELQVVSNDNVWKEDSAFICFYMRKVNSWVRLSDTRIFGLFLEKV